MPPPSDNERRLENQVADLKRQLAGEREGRMRAEALLDDTRRANASLRAEQPVRCQLCEWYGPRAELLDGEACPRCRLVL